MPELDTRFPPDWQLQTLENCMSAIIDYRGKSPEKTRYGIPLITAKVVKGGRILAPDEFIAIEDYDKWMRRGIPQPGDIVMTTEAPLGEVAQLDDQKVALAQRLITLRGKPGLLDNTFLKFVMQSQFVQDELKARATGTTVLGIRQSELRRILLPIPPIQEQERIAEILGALDDKIELNRRINETLEAIARAVFKSWFVDFDPARGKAKGHSPASLSAEIGQLFPGRLDSATGLPVGWKVLRLSDVCTTQYGYTASAADGPVGPKLLRVMDINKVDWIDWDSVPQCKIDESAFERYRLRYGDIVVARMADPGKCALIIDEVPAVFASYLVRLTTSSLARSFYVYGFLKSDAYREYAVGARSGSVQSNMNARVIVGASLVWPSEPVLNAFLRMMEPIRRKIALNLRESTTLISIRNSSLPKLMSGAIRLKDAEKIVEVRA